METALIVSKAFAKTKEYYDNVIVFLSNYSYYIMLPATLMGDEKRGPSKPFAYDVNKTVVDFSVIEYHGLTLTGDVTELEKFNLLDFKCILTLLLLNIPLEFTATALNSYGMYKMSLKSPHSVIRDALAYVNQQIAMIDPDDLNNHVDLIKDMNALRQENKSLKEQLATVRSILS